MKTNLLVTCLCAHCLVIRQAAFIEIESFLGTNVGADGLYTLVHVANHTKREEH